MNPPLPANFSLVLGGPLFQIWRRARLAGDALQLLHRRIVVLTLLAWVPLLVLSVREGRAWGGSVALPFLNDIEMHARLLLAMPLLIAAELIVHRQLRPIVAQFVERGLIPDAARPAFDAAVASAMRLRNSIWAEAVLIVLVYGIGVALLWRTFIALDVSGWHGMSVDGRWRPSMAGWWAALVSLPVFQFLLVRWYFRMFVWARFLWQVSRLNITLIPTHPDRCGGLGFLGPISTILSPLLLAQGTLVAGMMANRIFYTGARLTDFGLDLVGVVVWMMLVVLGPLLVFGVRLEVSKRAGLLAYGALAQRYVRDFDRKWLRAGAPPDEPLVGSADLQSLADLGTSFDVVREMRWVPFTWPTVLQLIGITLLPVLPLTLTMLSLRDLLERVLRVAF